MGKPKDSELEKTLKAAMARMGYREVWYHKASGSRYVVESVALVEKTLEPVVVYRRATSSEIRFTRPVDEFLEKFVVP